MNDLTEMEKAHVEVLQIHSKAWEREHPLTVSGIETLASIYQLLGQWNDTAKVQEEIAEIRKAALGPENPLSWRSMSELVTIYYNCLRN